MIRYTRWICTVAATAIALVSSQLHAANRYWVGGAGTLTDTNYSNGTTGGFTAGSGDVVHIGAGGTVTYATAGAKPYQKLRVGHIQGTNTALHGDGTVTISGDADVSLTVGGTGNGNASLWVGNGANGTLNIDGTGTAAGATSVTVTQLIAIGYGDSATFGGNPYSGTVNVTNGAALIASAGNINIGDRVTASGTGAPGHLTMSGAGSGITISNATADLNVGVQATSTYTQSDGAASIGEMVTVGQNGAANSSFSMTGGTHINSGMTVGQDTAHGSSLSVTGGILTTRTGGVILIGTNSTQNASMTVGSTAILNLGSNITVGDSTSQNASLTVSTGAFIDIPGTASAGNIFIGRGTSTGASFTMTGGTINLGNHFLMGSSSGASGIVGNQSAGIIETTNNFVLSDTGGSSSTYTLSGSGQIEADGWFIVGRQSSTTTMTNMVQSGGSVTTNKGVAVGRAENATTSLWGQGTYEVSGGSITANQATGTTGLWLGSQGTGTFRVIGQGATIDINGDMIVNSGGGAQGTLAYKLEAGETLSVIDVSGTATFAAGAVLEFDPALESSPQTSYDLVVAGSIVDNGISFNVPGWAYRIVYAATPSVTGDHNQDKVVNLADYVTWRSNDGANDQGYVDYRANLFAHGRQILQVYQPVSGASLQGAGVPEPAGIMLLLCGAFGLMSIRHR